MSSSSVDRYEVAVIGAGIAGSFAAFHLSEKRHVALIDGSGARDSASDVAAGLVNPFMGRKANPTWRWEEALDALEQTLDEAGLESVFDRRGILRPAFGARQREAYRERSVEHPHIATWCSAEEVADLWPVLDASEGLLSLKYGGAVAVEPLLSGLARAARDRGAHLTSGRVVDIKQSDHGVRLEGNDFEIEADLALMCVGADYVDWKMLDDVPLHGLKGQTIIVNRPTAVPTDLPCVSGPGYIVPHGDFLTLGSTHHHEFDNRLPTDEDTMTILEKTRRVLPPLVDADVLGTWAGVRVTVPGTRLPLVGPLPSDKNVWIATGLGSKGLLMGALIGRDFPTYLNSPRKIPGPIRTPDADAD